MAPRGVGGLPVWRVLFAAVGGFVSAEGQAEKVPAQGMNEGWEPPVDLFTGPGRDRVRGDRSALQLERRRAEHAGLAGDMDAYAVGGDAPGGLSVDGLEFRFHAGGGKAAAVRADPGQEPLSMRQKA